MKTMKKSVKIGLVLILIALGVRLLFAIIASGPSVYFVKDRVWSAISTNELICLGGKMARESHAVFEVRGEGVTMKTLQEMEGWSRDGFLRENVNGIVRGMFRQFGISVGDSNDYEILEYRGDFYTIWAYRIEGRLFLVYL